jgi:DNA-directed RNA polymerase subunit F
MKSLDEHCQAVWDEPTADGKRDKISEMINSFDHKKKAAKYLEQVQTMDPYRLDKFASDLMLRDVDRVI